MPPRFAKPWMPYGSPGFPVWRADCSTLFPVANAREEFLRELSRQQQEAEAARRAAAAVHQANATAVASVSADAAAIGALANQNALALAGLEQNVVGVQQEVADLREAVEAIVDSDGDGAPDAEDLCPDEPGVASLHGCPVQ
jgi:hypothetical protein